MDLRQQLERAIPHRSSPVPPEERVAAGRAALRRRRTAVAAGVAAVVVAVAVPVAVAAGGSAGRSTHVTPAVPPGTSPTGRAPGPPEADRTRPAVPWSKGEPPVRVDYVTGTIEIRDGAVVHERRSDLFPGKATDSIALDLTFRGERHWVFLEWGDGGGFETNSGPGDDLFDTFDAFVAGVVASGGVGPGAPPNANPAGHGDATDEWPTPGEVTGLTVTDERFVSDGTVTILDQQRSPDLPDNFASQAEPSAAAYVEQGGTRYLVLWRDTGGPPQFITVESAGHGDSLAELLGWARQRYASGSGLL